jgi:hypothetical protein
MAPYTGNPFVAVYEFGFVTTTLTIRLVTPHLLHVHSSEVFHDGTNRDCQADYFMHRAGGLPAAEYPVATIATCYSAARVSGTDQVGGLAGNSYAVVSDSHSAGEVSGQNDVGGLVGYSYGQITGCSAAGNVRGDKYAGGLAGNCVSGGIHTSYATGNVEGHDRVGGLAGAVDFGTVTRCYAAGSISGEEEVGGLIGHSWWGSACESHSQGTITGTRWVGGLAGWNSGSLIDCYSSATVSGTESVGGLVGSNYYGLIVRSYSIGLVSGTGDHVGGLVGVSAGSSRVSSVVPVTVGFWDIETSGQLLSADGAGKTTPEMQTAKTFLDAGWDFVGETVNGTDDIWWIDEGQDYPRLWWEGE